MMLTVAETVKRYMRSSRKFRKAIKRDPNVAKEALVRAGIAVRDKSSKSGIVLAKEFR